MQKVFKRAVQAAGFTAACSTCFGRGSTLVERFRLRRVGVGPDDGLDTFRATLHGAYDWTTGKEWLKKVKSKCPDVKWHAHYAILGPYDFMDIYEADDVETAHRVSLISRAEGAVSAESWQALPYDNYLKLLEEVQS